MSVEISWEPLTEWATPSQKKKLEAVWNAPRFKRVCKALKKLNLQPLLVGGVVRDLLLDRDNKDVDLIINCSAGRLMRMGRSLAKLTSATPVPLDKDRGTLRLCFSPSDEVDLVSLQGENLLADLTRRDLRINAMAIDVDGRLADPWSGREDLSQGVLREIRSENFQEDPLRVIRALRFAAQLGFTLDETTLENAAAAAAGLSRVAGERIHVELDKFFQYARPEQVGLLQDMRIAESILSLDPYDWCLLKELTAIQPVGLKKGLAVLFGPCLVRERREALFDRLKMSRKEQRYLSHWWDASALLQALESVEPQHVFRLSRAAAEAFQDLAETVESCTGPWNLSVADRAFIAREARGEGELRWDPPPWSGEEIKQSLGKPPGPWLGKALRDLEEQWALRRVESLEEALSRLPSS